MSEDYFKYFPRKVELVDPYLVAPYGSRPFGGQDVGGYAVHMRDCSWIIALFVTESEAKQYADYRNAALRVYGTTDHLSYPLPESVHSNRNESP